MVKGDLKLQSFVFLYETKEELDKAVEQLQSRHGFTGELAIRLDEDGKWRLTAVSEKRLRENSLDALPGERVTDG